MTFIVLLAARYAAQNMQWTGTSLCLAGFPGYSSTRQRMVIWGQ